MRRTVPALLLALLCALTAGCAQSPADEARPEAAAETAPVPAETPDPLIAEAEAILAGMDAREKAWQMIVAFPQDLTGERSTADAARWSEALAGRPAGGIVFDGDNIVSGPELKEMLAAAGAAGKRTAPLLCVDEEGGAVARVAYALGETTKFRAMFAYRGEGAETARANACRIAEDIASFGFNTDFAPVADVWTNPDNTVIGRRAYSDDAAEAAELVAAAVGGFHAGGVLCTLKHFPGHGDTAEDSHEGAAVCRKTRDALRECELLPFAAGIAAGADMVMVGHITLPALDPDRPATLSSIVVGELLRGELGFSGVVVTDALRMRALTACCADANEAAVLAVEAGCDLLLAPEDPDGAVGALLARVPEERLDESVRRILLMKLRAGITPASAG